MTCTSSTCVFVLFLKQGYLKSGRNNFFPSCTGLILVFEVCETFRCCVKSSSYVSVRWCLRTSQKGLLPLDKFQESLYFFATQCTWICQDVAKCYERWVSWSEKTEMDWQFVVGNVPLHDKWYSWQKNGLDWLETFPIKCMAAAQPNIFGHP